MLGASAEVDKTWRKFKIKEITYLKNIFVSNDFQSISVVNGKGLSLNKSETKV